MAAPKRTPATREADLVRLLKLLREGYTQSAAGAQLGVSRQQIAYDWSLLLKRLQAEQCGKTGALRAGKLAEYAALKEKARRGWRRSLRKAEELSAKTRTLPDGGVETATSKKTAAQVGDARFLAEMRAILDSECRLLGVVPPVGIAVSGPTFKIYGFDPQNPSPEDAASS